MPSVEILAIPTSLFVKSTILAAKWAGASRRRALESIASMPAPDKDKEIVFLRDRIEQLYSPEECRQEGPQPPIQHQDFLHWYNGWRPHMTLGGATPNDFYCRDVPEPVPHDAKVVPPTIERRRFAETRVTGFRLLRVA